MLVGLRVWYERCLCTGSLTATTSPGCRPPAACPGRAAGRTGVSANTPTLQLQPDPRLPGAADQRELLRSEVSDQQNLYREVLDLIQPENPQQEVSDLFVLLHNATQYLHRLIITERMSLLKKNPRSWPTFCPVRLSRNRKSRWRSDCRD